MHFYRRWQPVAAISFDLDDTLYDNGPAIVRAEQWMLSHLRSEYLATAMLDKPRWLELKRAVLLANPGKSAEDLFCFRFTPQKALPLVAVNLTHGTGSEVNRFAVVTVAGRNHRSIVGHDCSYPRYAIDDPALMTGLSAEQSRYVSIDALCRVVEAATTTVAGPLAVTLARETVGLVHRWLPDMVKSHWLLLLRDTIAACRMEEAEAIPRRMRQCLGD